MFCIIDKWKTETTSSEEKLVECYAANLSGLNSSSFTQTTNTYQLLLHDEAEKDIHNNNYKQKTDETSSAKGMDHQIKISDTAISYCLQ